MSSSGVSASLTPREKANRRNDSHWPDEQHGGHMAVAYRRGRVAGDNSRRARLVRLPEAASFEARHALLAMAAGVSPEISLRSFGPAALHSHSLSRSSRLARSAISR